MTMGADPIACAALAGGFAGKAFFVRKEVKAHGLARRIEGPLLDAGRALRGRRGRRQHRRLDARGDRGAAGGGPRRLRRDRGARPPDGRRRGDRGRRRRAVRRAHDDRRHLPGAPETAARGRGPGACTRPRERRMRRSAGRHMCRPVTGRCPRQESNLDLPLRRRPSSPLDYEGACLMHSLFGVERLARQLVG